MRLTTMLAFAMLLTACGGGSTEPAAPTPPTAGDTTTSAVPSLEERAQLFEYDASEPLDVVEKKTRDERGVEVVDLAFQAADRKVSAFLVRPKGKPTAAVLWAHSYGEENSDRAQFLPDALALAEDGAVSLLPAGLFPWQESVSEDPEADLQLIVEQTIQLRRGLDLLEEEAGDVPLGFVGHDYGAMYGSLLVADRRPQAYVLMAPDATFSNWFVKYLVRGASKPDMDRTFVPVDPLNNVPDAAPASILLQFAESDSFVPYYVADKLAAAASEPKKVETYPTNHAFEHDRAFEDRLAWLRNELGL
jgi:dienelactone hydrolase